MIARQKQTQRDPETDTKTQGSLYGNLAHNDRPVVGSAAGMAEKTCTPT